MYMYIYIYICIHFPAQLPGCLARQRALCPPRLPADPRLPFALIWDVCSAERGEQHKRLEHIGRCLCSGFWDLRGFKIRGQSTCVLCRCSWLKKDPESPSTQYLWTLVPKTIPLMAFGTIVLKSRVLGPSGGRSTHPKPWMFSFRHPKIKPDTHPVINHCECGPYLASCGLRFYSKLLTAESANRCSKKALPVVIPNS